LTQERLEYYYNLESVEDIDEAFKEIFALLFEGDARIKRRLVICQDKI